MTKAKKKPETDSWWDQVMAQTRMESGFLRKIKTPNLIRRIKSVGILSPTEKEFIVKAINKYWNSLVEREKRVEYEMLVHSHTVSWEDEYGSSQSMVKRCKDKDCECQTMRGFYGG